MALTPEGFFSLLATPTPRRAPFGTPRTLTPAPSPTTPRRRPRSPADVVGTGRRRRPSDRLGGPAEPLGETAPGVPAPPDTASEASRNLNLAQQVAQRFRRRAIAGGSGRVSTGPLSGSQRNIGATGAARSLIGS